jgi:putative PIG3 family NAD(P)H quinone oxidoreductase
MRCLEVSEHDGRYGAALAELPDVVPGPGEVLIRVTGSGVNRADLSQIAGRYPPPPGEPTGLGLEVSGVVEGTGARVCALLAGGGHAEWVAAPEGQIFPCPANLELVSGAAIPEAYLTAFVNLVVEAGLEAGQTALVHAGASGVGLAAIQVAKYLGARVAATTRTREKVSALEQAGADLALAVPSGDFAGPIAAQWGPGAVDVVLDPIGAATFAGDLAVLAPKGRIICLATMSGTKAELDVSLLMKKRARVVGSTLRSRTRAEKAVLVRRFAQDVLPGFAAGTLRPVIDSVLPPERAAEAFQRMRENKNVGKIVIAWS